MCMYAFQDICMTIQNCSAVFKQLFSLDLKTLREKLILESHMKLLGEKLPWKVTASSWFSTLSTISIAGCLNQDQVISLILDGQQNCTTKA